MTELQTSNAGDAGTSEANRAADRLRDSAKWLIAAFGAIGAVVFAGISVSNLNQLDAATDASRFYGALGAAFVAIIGVTLALTRAVYLAGASTTSLNDLTRNLSWSEGALRDTRSEIERDPALKKWMSLKDFQAAHSDAWRLYEERVLDFAEDPDESASSMLVDRARARLELLDGVAGRVLQAASLLRLQRSFQRSRILLSLYLGTAAVGALAFIWLSNPAADRTIRLVQPPARAVLAVDAATQTVISAEEGKSCATPQLVVYVLQRARRSGMFDVVTAPSATCAPT